MAKFAPGWRMTSSVLLFFPLLLTLGNWQLSRGAEKRVLEEAYFNQITALPVLARDRASDQPFQRVRLQGVYGTEKFLLDNQVLNGITGYWIVQVFNDNSGDRFLVNRGFWPGTPRREQLPEVTSPLGQTTVVGVIWPFTGLLPVLDDNSWSQGWPKRIQRMEIDRMASLVGAQADEIRLEAAQPGVRSAAPFAEVLSDAKHLGYAATWFGLALMLLVSFIVFGFRSAR